MNPAQHPTVAVPPEVRGSQSVSSLLRPTPLAALRRMLSRARLWAQQMLAGIPNFVLFTFVGILVAGHLLGFIYYVYTLANEPSLAEARDPCSTRCVRRRVVPMQGLLRKLLLGSCAQAKPGRSTAAAPKPGKQATGKQA